MSVRKLLRLDKMQLGGGTCSPVESRSWIVCDLHSAL